MSDSESSYSEEDLDDFMLRASSVLSKDNHKDRETMIESLKHHLSSIFNDKSEMENIFKTLNDIIFLYKSKKDGTKKIHKQPFKLYPLIFSFNPKSSYSYIDYFLTSLQSSISEDNSQDFPYLSKIFTEVITSFFSEAKKNKNIIRRTYVLDENKKNKLYEKLLNFCINNIKENEKIEQSFGCLLLTEFIENCPLVKDVKNFGNIFNIISELLEDRWFESKLDLLNCTISLIFVGEKNFKPYANACLFKILDFLTDKEWKKRKLAVNIVYTLLFYCKEEILEVKENVLDFLSPLKDDPEDEVREMCMQTINYIHEIDPDNSEDEKLQENIDNDKQKNHNRSLSANEKGAKKKFNQSSKITLKKKKKDNIMSKMIREKEIMDQLEKEYNEKRNNYSNSKKGMKNKNGEFEFDDSKKEKDLNEKINSALYEIQQQLKKIKEEQNDLYKIYDDVKQIIDKNYSSLNGRIKAIENKSSRYKLK